MSTLCLYSYLQEKSGLSETVVNDVKDVRRVFLTFFFNGIFFLSVYVLFHAFFYSYLQEDTLGVRDSRQGCPRCQEGVSDRVKNFEKCEKGKKKKDNRRKRADFACRNNIRVVKMKKAELQEREEKG